MKVTILDILEKKRDGGQLSWEEMKEFVKGAQDGNVHPAQLGSFLMACHLQGLCDTEVEHLMRAMMFSGHLLKWPADWRNKIASLQSTGSSGNKAKLILAPAMAACGLKCPIFSARGYDAVGGILTKLRTIPGFNGIKTHEEIEKLLDEVGCCVVQQPSDIAPAEGIIRDMAAVAGTSDNDAFKEACIISRVAALKLYATVIDIPYGPGEWVKSKEEALSMAANLDRLGGMLGIKMKVLVTAVNWPIGTMLGQSLEIAEAVRCLNMVGPPDLHELVIKLGGHMLHEAGRVDSPELGQQQVHRVIRDGKARKIFGEMLKAQGVAKSDLKSLLKSRKDPNNMSSVLPVANYFTHLGSLDKCGYIHGIDMKVMNQVMFDLVKASSSLQKDGSCAGGIQVTCNMGANLKNGECWAKMHHNIKLDENQIAKLRNAITLREEKPEGDFNLDLSEYHKGSFKEIRRARLSMPNIFSQGGSIDMPGLSPAIPEDEEEAQSDSPVMNGGGAVSRPKVSFQVADSDEEIDPGKKDKS